jgi:3D-(3,5/4)-trihydroxycyclohexane-1,2-dione acylhydrolase (decyclizing)
VRKVLSCRKARDGGDLLVTVRLTAAQALVRFLTEQYVERDGIERHFFAGCFGIFGHGNVAGVGQALQQYSGGLPYYQARNEQAMVHTASAYARQKDRLQAFACTTSIGPGATNMVTGAALATINRLPVLLLPGDVFASRGPDPVLQQLETPHDGTLSVNDCFRPVSRYWDRVVRPEQVMPAALAAMRVLTNQAETGAVTLALPQDVQTEAFDYPEMFFEKRIWHVGRPLPDAGAMERAVAKIRAARRPMIVAGGGVIYSEATEALRRLCERTGIPVGETQAGKGSLPYDHPCSLGAVGATGTSAANRAAREADLVIGVGTRWTDFTTASKTAFQNPEVRFVNINVADFDANKHAGLALVGDARATLEALDEALAGYEVDPEYGEQSETASLEWDREVERLYSLDHGPLPAQSEVIGAVNSLSDPEDVVVCAAGSMPGDLHKLWRTRDPKGYHVEYGYSCMGYEIAGGLGVKMAAPEREVYVMCGDGSYLMMNAEIVTSIQEGYKLTIVLVDNSGFSSIGALSRSVGSDGFGTHYRFRKNDSIGLDSEEEPGDVLPADLATNAESLGAYVIRTQNIEDLKKALGDAKDVNRTVVIHIPVDRYEGVPDYDSFWDVPVAEVSEMESVAAAREEYAANTESERRYL